MSYENKPNSGALFRNHKKSADTHPDYRGPYFDADGTEREISAWIKTSKKGDKYMSISVRDKWVPESQPPQPAVQPADEFEDTLPF